METTQNKETALNLSRAIMKGEWQTTNMYGMMVQLGVIPASGK